MVTERCMRRVTVVFLVLLLILSLPGFWAGLEVFAEPSPSPTRFLWGAATAAYQVEGGITNNDFFFFTNSQTIRDRVAWFSGLGGPPVKWVTAGMAVNSWEPEYYEKDFDYAALLGLNAFRIGLEWARIEPKRDEWDEAAIQHYEAMIDAMIVRGLTPIVTLHHFTLPLWVLTPPKTFEGLGWPYTNEVWSGDEYYDSLRGWENSETVDEFLEFVDKVVSRLKGRVDYWITLNEPVGTQIMVGYVGGVFPPGFVTDGDRVKVVLHNMLDAHVRAYDKIKAIDDSDADGDGVSKQVGLTMWMPWVEPAEPISRNAEAARNFDYFWNDYFLNAIVHGEEDKNYLKTREIQKRDSPDFIVHSDWKDKIDFIGLQYYRRAFVFHDVGLALTSANFVGGRFVVNLFGDPHPHGLLSDMGWELFPEGIYNILMKIKSNWNKPVIITENGLGERVDKLRAPYIVSILQQVRRAMDDGADVRGYIHWSLVDNYEWGYGYQPEAQFGLFHISTRDSEGRPVFPYHREITESALAYQQVIYESGGDAPTSAALDSAKAKFGTISPNGDRVIPPTKTHGRFWEGQTADRTRITLYLGYVETQRYWMGMIYRHNIRTWRPISIRWFGSELHFKERVFVEPGGPYIPYWAYYEYLANYTNGDWTGTFTYYDPVLDERSEPQSWSAQRIKGAGFWAFDDRSPWGPAVYSPWGPDYPYKYPSVGKFFYIQKMEGKYQGKFYIDLTFPTPRSDSPTRIPSWRAFESVEVGTGPDWDLRLNAQPLFDTYLKLSGNNLLTTVSQNSGSWTAGKYPAPPIEVPALAYIGYSGFRFLTLDPLNPVWCWDGYVTGGNYEYDFRFVENKVIYPFFAGQSDQYYKEHDPSSVLPLEDFQWGEPTEVMKIGAPETGTIEIETLIGTLKVRFPEVGTIEIEIPLIGTIKIGVPLIGTTIEIGIPEIWTVKIGVPEIGTIEIEIKIPLIEPIKIKIELPAIATKRRISFRAGGRQFIGSTSLFSVPPHFYVDDGTWNDIAGDKARRVCEEFPPIADAGPDQVVNTTTVTLDGSRSIEFDGMPLEYDWWPGIPSEQQIQKPTVTLPTGTHVIYLKVYNRYTDRWSHNTDEVVIIADDKPPVTSLDIGEPKFIDASSNIFVTSATSFTLTAEDNPGGSGVNSTAYRIYNTTYDTSWTTYTKPFNLTGLSEDTYNIDYNSTDKAGNVEATNTTTVILDNTAPTTTLTIGEPKYISHTTYVTSATLYKLVATDNAGSEVAHTHYKIGVDPWTEGTSFSIIGPDGTYVCKWYSIDNLGNVETENSETVILDNTSPTTTLTIGELKYISDTIYVTPDTPFTLKATDTGSGVYSTAYRIRSATYDSGWQIYAAPFKLTSLADGTFTIEYYSTDNVKNVEPTQTVRITLFSWNYVFKDTQGRGTILKINTFHKFFQFIAPSNDYGIRKATKMLWLVPGTSIKIEHRDSQLILYATIDVKLDFCYAIAWDLQTGKINYLYDPAGIES